MTIKHIKHKHARFTKKAHIKHIQAMSVTGVLAAALVFAAFSTFSVQTPKDVSSASMHAAALDIHAGSGAIGADQSTQMLQKQTKLLSGSIVLTFSGATKSATGILLLKDHPQWIQLKDGIWADSYVVDATAIQASLEKGEVNELPLRKDSQILSTEMDPKNVLRAKVTQVARAGFVIDTASAAKQIADAFMNGQTTLILSATYSDPVVTQEMPDGTMKTYELLSTGYSDFLGSTPGRFSNVHKAINERISTIVLKQGEVFSLVPALDAPITLQKGWKMDLGLFGGGAALTPGAGICQSATTLYRAALLAGLPIVEKANHSLFVDHYELYGIGLDATVFPGVHNLRFKNDTGNDIIIQAYTDDPTAIVHIFGTKDGRTSILKGPYFPNTPAAKHPNVRALGRNEIGWTRTVTMADGSSRIEPIIARYAKPYWHSLMVKYGDAKGMALMVPAGR